MIYEELESLLAKRTVSTRTRTTSTMPRRAATAKAAAKVAVRKSTRPKRSFAERELDGTKDRNYDPAKKKPRSVAVTGATVTATDKPFPTRHPKKGSLIFKDHTEFYPRLTPQQIMEAGAFGGTYWRPITSEVTGETYRNAWKEFDAWFGALNAKTHLARGWKSYDKTVNKYGAKCGGTLQMWESSGWIDAADPYGWFQWYCRFTAGRRCSDDARQIKRWRGVCSEKGRFRNQLIGKCARAGKRFDDISISPVIRQSLLHWGYELTASDAAKYVKLKGLPTMPK